MLQVGLEMPSFSMYFHAARFSRDRPPSSRKGVALKTSSWFDFHVQHISGVEHQVFATHNKPGSAAEAAPIIDLISSACERECLPRVLYPLYPHYLPLSMGVAGSIGSSTERWSAVSLIPFWAGSPKASGGNAHSR